MPDNQDSVQSATPRTKRKSATQGRARGRRTPPQPRERASTRGSGGRYAPLQQPELERIHQTVLDILETVGMSDVPDFVQSLVVANGGKVLEDNRLSFPPALIERALDGLQRDITLCGQSPEYDLHLKKQQVHTGSGGAAPLVVDLHTGDYRDSTLADLYAAARLVDTLDNVHFFSRSVVARDMLDPLALDINTAYASLTGTRKHVMVSASNGENVASIADLCFTIAGSREAFLERPFLSLNINHVVSPLRFSYEACEVLTKAARIGLPVHVNTFGQLGASSPVTIAGCIAQSIAETLAGIIYVWLVNPDVKAIFGPRPMVTDLRTGSMAGGAGEQATLTAVAVQMANFYGLSNSTIAGATDSKIADAQSGYEKSLSVSLAAQTGSNLITQACGMQAGLMGCSFESYVVDNEMLGTILRSLAPIEISDDVLSAKMVQEVVRGDGHFLGHADTLKRMQTDFLYPQLADRRNHEVWAADGAPDIRQVANQRAREIINSHFPTHIDTATDAAIRAAHDIRLPTASMRAH